MKETPVFLVIGGDSFVGKSVASALRRRGRAVIETTRRANSTSQDRVFLDFENAEEFVAPPGVTDVLLIAAATNYERCEKDPMARVINVELIPRLISSLLSQDVFVTYISTNSVFGGDRSWPLEDDPHAPGIPYAQQKSESESVARAEAQRLDAASRLSIVRLTKILDASVSPLPGWLSAWRRGEAIEPFSDLIFAPMSVSFAGEAIASLGERRISGNLHLSGAENISYVTLAKAIAQRLKIDSSLVRPTTAVEKGVHIPFKPRFSGLGMARTTRLSGIEPQRLDDLVEDIAADNDARMEAGR